MIAIISAGLATFVNCLFQLVNKVLDNHKENKREQKTQLNEYILKKETIYISAIDRLLQIRRGFDYTRKDIINNKELQEEIKENNQNFFQIAAQLRLYSNDKIYNQYQRLSMFSIYAYAHENEPRLFEDSKQAYNMQITLLARQMQDDLGYRKYNNSCDTIMCPECGIEHDIILKCPNCGMSYEELLKKTEKIINQSLTFPNRLCRQERACLLY